MSVNTIHAVLVHPAKNSRKKPKIVGTSVPLAGSMFDLLNDIYGKSEQQCDVDITFRPTTDGKQQNDCRDLIIDYLSNSSAQNAAKIAHRLGEHTDRRSGLGLLFLIAGKVGREHKIVLSRFPTDSAIYVDENPNALSVQFLERVFMKNKTSYKAVLYRHASLTGGLWSGKAIDRQLNPLSGEPSNYWISDFLLSDFTTTSAGGTRRIANAIRDAVKNAPLELKQELTAAGTLAPGLAGQSLSIGQFCSRLGLSAAAKAAIASQLKSSKALEEVFKFDAVIYRDIVAFKSIELSNGATLTADTEKFDSVFQQQPVDGTDEVKYVTKGKVVDERFRTSR